MGILWLHGAETRLSWFKRTIGKAYIKNTEENQWIKNQRRAESQRCQNRSIVLIPRKTHKAQQYGFMAFPMYHRNRVITLHVSTPLSSGLSFLSSSVAFLKTEHLNGSVKYYCLCLDWTFETRQHYKTFAILSVSCPWVRASPCPVSLAWGAGSRGSSSGVPAGVDEGWMSGVAW